MISLPEGDEGERSVIASLVRRERDALARRSVSPRQRD